MYNALNRRIVFGGSQAEIDNVAIFKDAYFEQRAGINVDSRFEILKNFYSFLVTRLHVVGGVSRSTDPRYLRFDI